jgi:hypothetical protein
LTLTAPSNAKTKRIGPYCAAIRRGALGDKINGRSPEGKFIRKVEAELTAQLGGSPTFAQTILIRRVARLALQAELFDERFSNGTFTEYDGKVYGGVCHAIRLCLLSLGVPELKRVLSTGSGGQPREVVPATPPAHDLTQLSNSQLDRLYALLTEASSSEGTV